MEQAEFRELSVSVVVGAGVLVTVREDRIGHKPARSGAEEEETEEEEEIPTNHLIILSGVSNQTSCSSDKI